MVRTEQAKEDMDRLISDNRDILAGKRVRKYSDRRRAIVYILRRYYGLSLKEISEMTGRVTYSAVSKQYSIAEADVRNSEGCYKEIENMAGLLKFKIKI